jgi:hypothetical protein
MIAGRIQRLMLAWLLFGAWTAACTGPVPTLPAPSNHYALDGFVLDYPADWALFDELPLTTGPGQIRALLGTLPWGDCARSDINCHYQERLGPGEIQVEVGIVGLLQDGFCAYGQTRPDLAGRGPTDPIATGSLARVAGRPAIVTVYAPGADDYYRADEERAWMIAVPETLTEAYTIRAMYRGPGLEELRAEVDRLIASIRLGPASFVLVGPAPSDCPAPFPSPEAP